MEIMTSIALIIFCTSYYFINRMLTKKVCELELEVNKLKMKLEFHQTIIDSIFYIYNDLCIKTGVHEK